MEEFGEFEVLTAVVVKSSIFWVVKLLKVNGRFEGIFCLHLRGWKINQTRSQHETGSKQRMLCSF
jgi:hypothetical protein